MEMPLVNESSFTPANPASYSLEDFWPVGDGIEDDVRVLERRAGVVMDSLGNRDGSAEESTVTEQSLSRNGRKRRVVVESSAVANTSTCGGEDMKNSSSKRAKVVEVKEEKRSLKEELDGTSVACTKHGKQNTNNSELPKQDYIHVRARRGQATDSHSLAERARREKISERMKTLQDLVPGCNKVVGKALVLDEIINYILSLQHQVEFLSMKLEAINSSIIPSEKMLPDKNLAAGMAFGAQPTEEYAQGPQSEWLHMHLGENFQRATQ